VIGCPVLPTFNLHKAEHFFTFYHPISKGFLWQKKFGNECIRQVSVYVSLWCWLVINFTLSMVKHLEADPLIAWERLSVPLFIQKAVNFACPLSALISTIPAPDLPELLTCGRGPGLQALLGHWWISSIAVSHVFVLLSHPDLSVLGQSLLTLQAAASFWVQGWVIEQPRSCEVIPRVTFTLSVCYPVYLSIILTAILP